MNTNNLSKVLPIVIIDLIKKFIPNECLVFVNKKNYFLYHYTIKSIINNYENYIRDMIRNDNAFVFQMIINENYKIWNKNINYKYKNMIFKNYVFF